MTDSDVIDIALQTMLVALKLSAPVLLPALAIGFVISVIQSMTQIQEFTLAFVPKVIGIGVALIVSGNWMLHTMIDFTVDLFERIPTGCVVGARRSPLRSRTSALPDRARMPRPPTRHLFE